MLRVKQDNAGKYIGCFWICNSILFIFL